MSNESKDNEPTRRFQGIWIPRAIWIGRELTCGERLFLGLLLALYDEESEGTSLTDQQISLLRGPCSSASGVANMITRLRRKGYVETVAFYGRGGRVLKVILPTGGANGPG